MNTELFDVLILIAFFLLIATLLITFIKMLKGPHVVNRIISFDLMTANLIGIITVYSIYTHNPLWIDISIVLALIGFLVSIAYAFYLKNKIEENQ